MRNKEGIKRIAFLTAFFVVIIAIAFFVTYKEDNRLEVDFLDVGQGDAALIQTPHHKLILVDAGPPDKKVLRRLGEVLPFWEKHLDLVILTHPHDDHFGSMADVLRRYNVASVMATDYETKQASYSELLKVVEQQKIPVLRPWNSDFVIDNVHFNFLFPYSSMAKTKLQTANNASIVFKLSYGTMDFLFTGDAEAPVEEKLLANNKNDLEAEVLKLGHHGSDTSSTEDFLKTVKPQFAIASVGINNTFGHPSPLIINRLARLGIQFYRTDQDGTITFFSNGNNLFRSNTCLIGCSSL